MNSYAIPYFQLTPETRANTKVLAVVTSLNAKEVSGPKARFADWSVPIVFLLLATIYILNSYPMIRPGFDIWWHLGAINNPRALDPASFPPPRIYWHEAWHFILTLLNITDLFDRALVIHRTQFLLMFGLLTASAYLILSSMVVAQERSKPQLLSFSLMAAILWCVMTGTRSVARGHGIGSDVTQSWILWYSVNYQISLGFSILAIASTLYAVSVKTKRARILAICLSVTCLLLTFLTHMAEIVYYLLSVLLLSLFFVRRRSTLIILFGLLILSLVFGGLVLRYSYARPQILDLLNFDSTSDVYHKVVRKGFKLRNAGRLNTAWTTLHFFSALFIAFGACTAWMTSRHRNAILELRATLFVLSTALFPLALFSNVGIGLYALITYDGIAYRFAYSSLLFVGIPLGALVLTRLLLAQSNVTKQILFGSVIVFTGFTSSLVLDWNLNEDPAAYKNARSLTDSLDPHRSYFISNAEDRGSISILGDLAKERDQSTQMCVGLFASYYLFFVDHYENVESDVINNFRSRDKLGKKPYICSYLDNAAWFLAR